MKTFEEILKPMRFPNEEYGSFDVCYNDCLTAFKNYHAQFTQPITEEEIEKEFPLDRDTILKNEMWTDLFYVQRCNKFKQEGAKWAIERMKKDDRELLVKFFDFLEYEIDLHYALDKELPDKFLNSNK